MLMNKYWPYSDRITLCILAPLVTLFAFGLDFYIPIVPHLRNIFGTSQETMQMTLSGFMFCCAVAQIIIGPLCDKYGRRPIALACLLIFIAGSLLAALFPIFTIMVIARILQAIGASGTFLCAYTTVRDLYPSPSSSAKIYSYINVCISQSSIFAPTLGGIIADMSSWRIIFVALAVIGFITLIITYYSYHETTPHKHPINYTHLKQSYNLVLTNRYFQVYSLAAAVGMGNFFMFFSQSPYIVMDVLQYSKPIYGLFFGIVGFSFFLTSLITHKICDYFSIHTTIEIGALLMTIGGALLILGEILFGITILGFIIPMMIVVSGAALCIGAGLAGTMQPFGSIAGIALSAVGFVKFSFSAGLGMLLMKLPISPLSLGALITCLSSISLLLSWYFRAILKKSLAQDIIIAPSAWD
jgi:Bcr/CflA subfamily drug resistance transporter